MKPISMSRPEKVADNNGTDLNLFQLHIEEECNLANIKPEEVEVEITKTESEVIGGSWVQQNVNVKELLANENRNLESSAEQLLNENSVCQSCNMGYTDFCMNCGHLIHILNNEVANGVHRRAMDSIPESILKIKGSLIDGYGVYALKNIPKGVKFGPYEGLEVLNKGNKYLWKIRYAKLVEEEGRYCNWMRYIDCATTQSAQNLIALQFMGKLYYKSLREIKIGEELLINYSNSSSDNLGLHRIQYFQPEEEKINENVFKCPPCYFGFSKEHYLLSHNKVCRYKKKIVIEVNSSPGIKAFQDGSKTCERINNVSANCQKVHENGNMHKKVGFGTEKNVSQQDRQENVKINNKEEKKKLKFPDDGTAGAPNKQAMVLQKKCREKYVILNNAKDKNQKSSIKSCHTMEKAYKCNDCLYTAVLKKSLLSHIRNHHMEKSYKCSECCYAAAQKCSLLSHIKYRHTVEKDHKCNECSYTAVLKQDLLTHIRICHTMEKPYKCYECAYATARKATLLTHIQFRHITEKAYKCIECSYTAVLKCQLLSHIRSRHTMETPYKCHECSYAATLKSNLLIHIKRRHIMQRNYQCNECSYTAFVKQQLICHITSHHTMEKPYKCSECSYATVKTSNLLSHIKHRHTKERAYKCNECSYAAISKYRLITHIKHRHTREKAYKCNECPYAAVQKDRLLSHIKIRHIMKKS